MLTVECYHWNDPLRVGTASIRWEPAKTDPSLFIRMFGVIRTLLRFLNEKLPSFSFHNAIRVLVFQERSDVAFFAQGRAARYRADLPHNPHNVKVLPTSVVRVLEG